jgi:hypothetical protein
MEESKKGNLYRHVNIDVKKELEKNNQSKTSLHNKSKNSRSRSKK